MSVIELMTETFPDPHIIGYHSGDRTVIFGEGPIDGLQYWHTLYGECGCDGREAFAVKRTDSIAKKRFTERHVVPAENRFCSYGDKYVADKENLGRPNQSVAC